MLYETKERIRLQSYRGEWHKQFQLEKDRLVALLGSVVVDIQHVGGTSIKMMDSQPIIDIFIGIDSLGVLKQIDMEGLRQLHYHSFPLFLDECVVCFSKIGLNRSGLTETHRIYFVPITSHHWNEAILFRNYLQSNSNARAQYNTIKQYYQNRSMKDLAVYTRKKREFHDKMIKKAIVKNNM
ncbi:MAG: GrpB family protein [Bacilli bacterium]